MAITSPSLANGMILVRVNNTAHNLELEELVLTGTTVYPGMFVRPDSVAPGPEGKPYEPVPDGNTDGWRLRIIAVENQYHGKTIDDPYLEGERMQLRVLRGGDMVLTKVTDDGAEGIIEGRGYTFDPNGWLRKWIPGTDTYQPICTLAESDPSPVLPRWTLVQII